MMKGAATMAWGMTIPWASGRRGWAKVEYRMVCKQYGISVEQGKEWIEKVRMMLDDDQNCLHDGAENLPGLSQEPHESFEMVTAVSTK